MTDDPITRLRMLYEQATPGEWDVNEGDLSVVMVDEHGDCHLIAEPCSDTPDEDARLIVAGHNLLPYLLDEIVAARTMMKYNHFPCDHGHPGCTVCDYRTCAEETHAAMAAVLGEEE